ncbi:MAG: epoxide hydrolase family protein [Chloroflexota bacterium]
MTPPQAFSINIPQAALDDLQARLARTRWPQGIEGETWDYGTNLNSMKALVEYWQNGYDWRAQEAMLNQFAQFKAEIDGVPIHFIHVRGKGATPTPIILSHGWPDSFYRFYKIIPLLTDPARFGGDPAQSFDVIVPSLPGFGFSQLPQNRSVNLARIAELWFKLMTDVLGYKRFAAGGGDFGSQITRLLALRHPEQIIGIHLTDIGYSGDPAFPPDLSNLSSAEQGYFGATQGWFYQEGAYAMIQATKPQSLAYGLSDSPVGLAAWIIEKFRTWSDCDGDPENSYSKDELLTNVMIYWLSETALTSMRPYNQRIDDADKLQAGQHIEVPAALARFPKDLGSTPPRELAERSLRIQRWTEMPRGGHFAALEEPELLVEDMRSFFRDLA